MDCKELTARHIERIYGEGEWELLSARDLKPGMIVTTNTMREEREIVAVSVDTDAQTVSVQLASESARKLGVTTGDRAQQEATTPIIRHCGQVRPGFTARHHGIVRRGTAGSAGTPSVRRGGTREAESRPPRFSGDRVPAFGSAFTKLGRAGRHG
ncbi:hypothetical protein ACFV20_27460 [Streptomyces sp. NPDC059696]|uniref:hypothetical protein n=1 Tax=Streptomyces sp. NPDC059696 TaxID=3346911 RepID=UPI00368F72DB